MIKITDELYVAASEIVETGLKAYRDGIYVLLRNGQQHYATLNGRPSYVALEDLVCRINEELAPK